MLKQRVICYHQNCHILPWEKGILPFLQEFPWRVCHKRGYPVQFCFGKLRYKVNITVYDYYKKVYGSIEEDSEVSSSGKKCRVDGTSGGQDWSPGTLFARTQGFSVCIVRSSEIFIIHFKVLCNAMQVFPSISTEY